MRESLFKIKKIKTKLTREDCFLILLSLVWLRTSVVSYFFSFFKVIPIFGELGDIIKMLLYIGAVLLAIPYMCSKIKSRDFGLFAVIVLLYFINMQIFPNTAEYLKSNFVYIILVNFSTVFIGIVLAGAKEKCIDVMCKCTRIAIVLFLLYFMIFGFSSEAGRTNSENMGLAYRILPHACFILLYSFKIRKWYDIVLGIISAILVLACGTRGAVLSLLGFVVCYILFFYKFKYKGAFVIGSGSIILIMCWNFNSIANILISFFNKYGLSTRVIESVVNGSILVDAPRKKITAWMLDAITVHPFRGYGLAGDRNLVPAVVYAHSIFLEMWVSYGVIIGSIILAVISILILRALFKANELQKGVVLAMIFGGGLCKLLVSSSYLLEFQFFMLIGYVIGILRNRGLSQRGQKRNEN